MPFPSKMPFNCVTISKQATICLDYPLLFEKFHSKHRRGVPFPYKSLIFVCDYMRDFCLLEISQTLAHPRNFLFMISQTIYSKFSLHFH